MTKNLKLVSWMPEAEAEGLRHDGVQNDTAIDMATGYGAQFLARDLDRAKAKVEREFREWESQMLDESELPLAPLTWDVDNDGDFYLMREDEVLASMRARDPEVID